MSITVERLQAHVEVTGDKQAAKQLAAFKAEAHKTIKSLSGEAKVKLVLNSRGLRTEAAREIKAIQATLPDLKVKLVLDTSGMKTAAAAALKNAGLGVGRDGGMTSFASSLPPNSGAPHYKERGDPAAGVSGGGYADRYFGPDGSTRPEVAERQRAFLGRKNPDAKAAAAEARATAQAEKAAAKITEEWGKAYDKSGQRLAKFNAEGNKGRMTLRGMKSESGGFIGNLFKMNQGFEAFGNLINAARLPAIGVGLGVAAQAIGSLAAGAVALVGPLGSVVGLLGGLPGLLVAGAGAFAVGKMALTGVMEAVKEKAAAEKAGAAQTKKYEIDQISNARAIKSANDSIRSSEHSLTMAQEQAVLAQKALVDARRDAARNLFDMRLGARQAALDEESATNSLADAKKRLMDLTMNDSGRNWQFNVGFVERTGYEAAKAEIDKQDGIRDANLEIKNSELAIIRVREERRRQLEDLAREEAKGVEGSDSVQAAIRGQRDALYAVGEAVRGVADAKGDLAETERLQAKAAKDAADAEAAATKKTTEAYDKLTPAGKALVDFYQNTLKPLFKEMRGEAERALLPGVQAGVTAALPFLLTFKDGIAGIGGVLGDLASRTGKMLGSGPWTAGFAELLNRSVVLIDKLGTGGMYFLNALKNVALVAKPVTDWMGDLAVQWGKAMDEWSVDKDGSLADFFERATVNADKLFDIVGSLWGGVKNVVEAARPLGDWILDSVVKLADKFQAWTEFGENQKKMAAYFNEQKEPLKAIAELIGAIATGIFAISRQNHTAELINMLRTDLLPVVLDLFEIMNDGEFGKAVVAALVEIVRLVTTFASSTGVLITTVKMIGGMAGAINSLLKNNPLLEKFLITWLSLRTTIGAAGFLAKVTGIAKGFGLMKGALGGADGASYLMGQLGIGAASSAAALGGVAAVAYGAWNWAKGFKEAGAQIQVMQEKMKHLALTGQEVKIDPIVDQYQKQYEDAVAYMEGLADKNVLGQLWEGIFNSGKIGKNQAIIEAKDAFDDYTFTSKASAKIISDSYDDIATHMGMTRDVFDAKISKMKLPDIAPNRQEWKDAFAEQLGKINDIGTSWDRALEKYKKYVRGLTGNTGATATAALGDSQRDLYALDTSKLGVNGHFDPSQEGGSSALSTGTSLAENAVSAAMQGVKDHKLSSAQAKRQLTEMVEDLRKTMTAKLGSEQAANEFLQAIGLGPDGIQTAFKAISKAGQEWDQVVRANADSSASWTEKLFGLQDSIARNGKSLDESTNAGRTNKAAVDGLIEAAKEDISHTQAGTIQRRMYIQALRDQLRPLFDNQIETDKYIAKMLGIPVDKVTKATFDDTQAVDDVIAYSALLSRLGEQVNTVAQSVGTGIRNIIDVATQTNPFANWNGSGGLGEGFGLPGAAGGGMFAPGSSFVVGEMGRERIDIDKTGHGRVTPITSRNTPAPYSGFEGDSSGASADDIARALKVALEGVDLGKKVEMNNTISADNPVEWAKEAAWQLEHS